MKTYLKPPATSRKFPQKHPADTWINEDFQVSYRDGLCFVRPFHIQLQQS